MTCPSGDDILLDICYTGRPYQGSAVSAISANFIPDWWLIAKLPLLVLFPQTCDRTKMMWVEDVVPERCISPASRAWVPVSWDCLLCPAGLVWSGSYKYLSGDVDTRVLGRKNTEYPWWIERAGTHFVLFPLYLSFQITLFSHTSTDVL